MVKQLSQRQIADIFLDLSQDAREVAVQINEQLNSLSYADRFYLGLLDRLKTLCKDVSLLINVNEIQKLDSAFIICRALVDDFIRLFAAHSGINKEIELAKIDADALKHGLRNLEESVKINNKYYDGNLQTRITINILKANKTFSLGDYRR